MNATFDRNLICQHVEMLHSLAAGVEGNLIIGVYGEDPMRKDAKGNFGVMIHSQVLKFNVGDVDGMVGGIMAYDGIPHANVYAPLHVMRRDLGPKKRGTKQDIRAVLGLVADMDADTGKVGKLPFEPSFEIESSPGNSQPAILFEKPIGVAEAEPLAKALQAATVPTPERETLSTSGVSPVPSTGLVPKKCMSGIGLKIPQM